MSPSTKANVGLRLGTTLKFHSKQCTDAALVSNLCPMLAFAGDAKITALWPCLVDNIGWVQL